MWPITSCHCSSQLLPLFFITPLTFHRGIFSSKEMSRLHRVTHSFTNVCRSSLH
ncbi:unnamed protein product, partial [Staurois parvus]